MSVKQKSLRVVYIFAINERFENFAISFCIYDSRVHVCFKKFSSCQNRPVSLWQKTMYAFKLFHYDRALNYLQIDLIYQVYEYQTSFIARKNYNFLTNFNRIWTKKSVGRFFWITQSIFEIIKKNPGSFLSYKHDFWS